jgi:hypothetical protein
MDTSSRTLVNAYELNGIHSSMSFLQSHPFTSGIACSGDESIDETFDKRKDYITKVLDQMEKICSTSIEENEAAEDLMIIDGFRKDLQDVGIGYESGVDGVMYETVIRWCLKTLYNQVITSPTFVKISQVAILKNALGVLIKDPVPISSWHKSEQRSLPILDGNTWPMSIPDRSDMYITQNVKQNHSDVYITQNEKPNIA